MPDIDLAAARRLPLEAVGVGQPASAKAALASLGPRARFIVRAREAAIPLAAKALSFDLSAVACRSAAKGDVAALWLGPDEWLVIAPAERTESLGAALAVAFAGAPASVVDVSHRHTSLTLAGPRAADVLNAFVPLDLGPVAFPVGACTRTLCAKAEIVLWRIAPETFQVECMRSMGPYVWGSLEDARREFLD